MVNVGRPSRGCLTCRRRRVKCDENQPNCNRCVKLNTNCEWKDQWSSLVRPQESWAERKVAQRVERVQNERKLRDACRQNDFGLYKQLNAVTIPKQCQIGPEIYAINRFYSDYAFDPVTCPFLYAVQPMYQKESTPSCLRNVVPAIALANAAKLQQRYDLLEESVKYYGRSLRHLAQCLNDPEVAKRDDTMLTVYILGLYEAISFDRRPTTSHNPHAPGRLVLLRLRGREQLQTHMGRNLFLVVYHEHLITSLDGMIEPMEECPSWVYEGFPPSPLTTLTLFMHDISCFLSGCRKTLSRASGEATRDRLFLLLHTGISLHKMAIEMLKLFQSGELDDNLAFQFYSSTDPRRKNSVKASKTSLKQLRKSMRANEKLRRDSKTRVQQWPQALQDIPSDIRERFDEIQISNYSQEYLNSFRASCSMVCHTTHIYLLTTLLQVVAALRSWPRQPELSSATAFEELDLATLEVEWNQTICNYASDILKEIPDSLILLDGDKRLPIFDKGMAYRAFMLVWHLRTALGTEQATARNREECRKWLRHIGEEYGIGIAMEALETNKCSIPHGHKKTNPSRI